MYTDMHIVSEVFLKQANLAITNMETTFTYKKTHFEIITFLCCVVLYISV